MKVISDNEEILEVDGEVVVRRTRITETCLSREKLEQLKGEKLAKAAELQGKLDVALEEHAKFAGMIELLPSPPSEPTDESKPVPDAPASPEETSEEPLEPEHVGEV